MYDGPVLDNHLHLDPVNGRGVEAAEEFERAGGTHLHVLNKPSWNLVGEVDDDGDSPLATGRRRRWRRFRRVAGSRFAAVGCHRRFRVGRR